MDAPTSVFASPSTLSSASIAKHVRAMNKFGILASLLVIVLGISLPAAMVALEPEAPEKQSQPTEEQEAVGQKEIDIESGAEEKEQEDPEQSETPSLVEDIIPSEMISDDLAVDFPVDI